MIIMEMDVGIGMMIVMRFMTTSAMTTQMIVIVQTCISIGDNTYDAALPINNIA